MVNKNIKSLVFLTLGIASGFIVGRIFISAWQYKSCIQELNNAANPGKTLEL